MAHSCSALIAAATITSVFVSANQAHALDSGGPLSELRGGVLAHDRGPFGGNEEDGVAINAEFLFDTPDFLEWALEPRPIIGFSLAPKNNATSHAYLGLAWEQDLWRRLFGYGSIGAAIHDADQLEEIDPDTNEINPQKALGCRGLLHTSFGLGFRITDRANVALHVEHISNANLCDKNEGIDNIGVRLGWSL